MRRGKQSCTELTLQAGLVTAQAHPAPMPRHQSVPDLPGPATSRLPLISAHRHPDAPQPVTGKLIWAGTAKSGHGKMKHPKTPGCGGLRGSRARLQL
jgi:hypothetical protein